MDALGSLPIMRIGSSDERGEGFAVLGPTSEPNAEKSGVGAAFQRSTGITDCGSISALEDGVGNWEVLDGLEATGAG